MSFGNLKFVQKSLLENVGKFHEVIEKCEANSESIFQSLCEDLKQLKNFTQEISSFASTYDFSESSPGNGYWSFVHVSLAALDYSNKELENTKRRNIR